MSADAIRPVVGAVTYPIGSSGSASNQLAQDDNLAGISVSGQGRVSGTPDLATVNLGVEAFRDTVQLARDYAAAAMKSMIVTLKDYELAEGGIKTSRFGIHPRFDPNGQGIIGFQINNQLTVKIRNLDMIGKIIDNATLTGGNLTRFQGITFSI